MPHDLGIGLGDVQGEQGLEFLVLLRREVEGEEGQEVDGGGGDADAGQAELGEAEVAVDEDPVEAGVDGDRGDGDLQEGLGAAHPDGELADGLEPEAGQQAGGECVEQGSGEVDDGRVLAEPGQGLAYEDHQDGAGDTGEGGHGEAGPDDRPYFALCVVRVVCRKLSRAVRVRGGGALGRLPLGAGGRGGYPVADGRHEADAHGAQLVEDDDRQAALRRARWYRAGPSSPCRWWSGPPGRAG